MAYVGTYGLWYPAPGTTVAPSLVSNTISAGTHRFAWCGRMWNKDRATKTINFVGFLPGAVSAGGSTARLSLQDLDTANAGRPDGTVDQSQTFADSSLTSFTFFDTSGLTALGRSVAFGAKLAVVLDYSSYSAGSIVVNSLTAALTPGTSWGTTFNGTTWTGSTGIPNIILGFSDGTFGTLGHPGGPCSFPLSALNTHTTGTNTTPDEIALRFMVPFQCTIDGCWFYYNFAASTRDAAVRLYEGTTLLATEFFDTEQAGTGLNNRTYTANFGAEIILTPGVEYFLAIKPNSAGTGTIYSFDVANADHFQACYGGPEWHYAERTDNGSWSPVTTRRMFAGLIISSLSDVLTAGAGGGGSRGVIGS